MHASQLAPSIIALTARNPAGFSFVLPAAANTNRSEKLTRMLMPKFYKSFLLCLFILVLIPPRGDVAFAQSPKTIKLILQGEPSPLGGVFNNLGVFSFNDHEDLVFKSDIESFKSALFLSSGGNLSRIIADGDSIGGLGKFDRVFSNGTLSLNNEGRVAFAAQLTNGGSVRNGLFLAADQRISPIVFHGDPVEGGTLESPTLFSFSLNNNGAVAFDGFITPGPEEAIFVSNGSSISKVVATGEVTPVGGTFKFAFLNISDFNDAGTVIFIADIENGSSTKGIFSAINGNITKIVGVGDASPDGKEFTYLDNHASINTLGDIVFEASVGEGFEVDYNGIFLYSNGGITLISRNGNPAPGGGTFSVFSSPTINDEKQMIFESSIEGGTSSNGIFSYSNQTFQKVALTGEITPAGGNYSGLSLPLLNAGGSVPFFSYMNGGNSASGIFLWNGGPRLELSRDTIEFTDVVPGQTAQLGLAISNSGGKTLEVMEITISPSPPYGLENVPSLPLLLQPEQSSDVVVTYAAPEGNNSNLSKIVEALENGSLTIKTNAPHPTTTLPVIAPGITLKVDVVPSSGTEVKAGQFATIEIKVVDQSNKLVDYDGGATINLVESQSTPGITRLPQTQSVLVTDGIAQPVFFLTPKEPFAADKPIDLLTVLAGKAVIEVKLENSSIPAVTKTIEVKSPLDLFIDRIEIQQSVKNTDKDVFQEYMPGVSRAFPALPFIAEHNTIVQIFVGLNNPTFVPYSKIELDGITGELRISQDGARIGLFQNVKSGGFGTRSFIFKSSYTSAEQENLQDALVAFIDYQGIAKPGLVSFDAELSLGSNLEEVNEEKENNLKLSTGTFAETRLLRVLSYTGKRAGVSVDETNPSTWDFIKDVYPVQNSRVVFTDPGRRIYTFSGGFFSDLKLGTLRGLLDRYNKENPEHQCVVLLMFAPLDICQAICSNPNSGGCAESINGRVGVVTPGSPGGVAHEIGHMLGLRDTYKTDKYTTDDGEPNPRRSNATNDGNPAENGNIHLITREKVVEGTNRFEFMGTGLGTDRTTWNYLYQKLFRVNSGNPEASNKQRSVNSFIAVSGTIDTNNTVTLNPFLALSQVPAVSEPVAGDYSIEFQDNTGHVLSSLPFDIEFSIPDAGEQPQVPFSFYLPYPEGTSKVTMKRNGIEIADRIFSTNAPVVQLMAPQSGETIRGMKTIVWTASDIDGGKLTYDLMYSLDGIEQNILAVNLEDTSYVWESNVYPYSPSASLTIVANDGINEGRFTVEKLFLDSPVDVENKAKHVPSEYILEQNYPNPFNPSTTITWQSPVSGWQTIKVFDVLGNEVATLVDAYKPAGRYEIEFDGRSLSSGVYFYRLKAGQFTSVRKMFLLR